MTTEAKNAWVAKVLGVRPRTGASSSQSIGTSATPAPGAPPKPPAAARPASTPTAAPAAAPPPAAPAEGPNAAVIAQITATLAALDAQSKRLKDDGIPADPLDTQIARLRARLAALAKPGAAAKQLTALQADAAKALDRVKGDADRQADSMTAGSDKAIHDLRDAAAKQLDKLDAGNPKKADLAQQLKDLDAEIKDLQRATDPAKQAAGRQKADDAAQKLLDAVVKAGGSSKEAQKEVQAAYKKAVEEKFGITLGKNNTLVTDNTHFDKVYRMFEQVPVGHVVQDKLKDLSYNKRLMVGAGANKHGIGLFTGTSIQLGDYGEETWPYKDPNTGKAERPNGFSISVLHELGHSVDSRWGIMEKYQGEKGCGTWQYRDVSVLAQEIADAFTHSAGNAVPAAVVKQVVLEALNSGTTAGAPAGTDPDGLKKLQAHLAPWIKLKKSAAPYAVEHSFNGRRYIPRGGKAWLSYLASERASLQVTAYQWSAPAEWFAELYAICWYKKEPGPASVHERVRAYLPQQKGGGGGPGAPGSAPGAPAPHA